MYVPTVLYLFWHQHYLFLYLFPGYLFSEFYFVLMTIDWPFVSYFYETRTALRYNLQQCRWYDTPLNLLKLKTAYSFVVWIWAIYFIWNFLVLLNPQRESLYFFIMWSETCNTMSFYFCVLIGKRMIERSTLFFAPIKIDSYFWKHIALTSSASPALKLALDCQLIDENFEENLWKCIKWIICMNTCGLHFPKFSELYEIYWTYTPCNQ